MMGSERREKGPREQDCAHGLVDIIQVTVFHTEIGTTCSNLNPGHPLAHETGCNSASPWEVVDILD